MDKALHQTEKPVIDDSRERGNAAAHPQHYYPRPEDVLADASLSLDDKRAVLEHWQLTLEDRAGALGRPHGATSGGGVDAPDEDREVIRAIDAARRRLGMP
jgi:hypothetical protein